MYNSINDDEVQHTGEHDSGDLSEIKKDIVIL